MMLILTSPSAHQLKPLASFACSFVVLQATGFNIWSSQSGVQPTTENHFGSPSYLYCITVITATMIAGPITH